MTSRQKTLLPIVVLLVFIGIVAVSCGDKYVYKAEKNIQQAQWAYTDTLDFKMPVADTSQLYNLYINFVHADTFPNQNIYLKLYTRFPDGKRISRIRSFDLFDTEGKPKGECSSTKCETKILLQDKLYFNQTGDYLLTLEQFTRSSPLSGIAAVGIMLEKTEKKR